MVRSTDWRSERPHLSRLTLVCEASAEAGHRIRASLFKLENVVDVDDLAQDPSVTRELALIKVAATPRNRAQIFDLVEVFRARIQDVAPSVRIREVNALYGIGIDPLVEHVQATADAGESLSLRGNPPVGTCTICVGKKEIGWQAHFGVVRALENQTFYRGE